MNSIFKKTRAIKIMEDFYWFEEVFLTLTRFQLADMRMSGSWNTLYNC